MCVFDENFSRLVGFAYFQRQILIVIKFFKDYLFNNQKYSEQFFIELRKYFIQNQFTDVKINCNNEEILCHKIVLAAFSKYFYAMFTSNLLETQTNTVNMDNVDINALRDLINYAYCGSIELNIQNVQNILSLASLLQVFELIDACADYMETQLEPNNCINVYYFASLHNCLKLKSKSKEYVDKHFCDVMHTDEFRAIEDPERICEFINSDDLNIEKEQILLLCIFKWINVDYNKRIPYAERLSKYVRYSLIDDFTTIENLLVAEIDDSTKREHFKGLVRRLSDERSVFIDKKRAGKLLAQ